MKKVVTASVIAVALAYIFDNTYQSTKNAESAGQQVRNRLQGSDVSPEDDMLSTPSIYRDWVMVQKGYQSLRMMNDNDNFDAEEAHFNIYEESFSGEWHYFSECETKGCDGNIEYRDVYACPSCGQDDIEILIGDTCPDCGVVAEEVSKYAIFYCSDCDEDYTDMYNSEVQTASNKVRTISGGPLQLRKLTHDKNLKPEDAMDRLDISAEGMRTCSQCEMPKHPLYRGSGSLMGARQICRECNMKAMEGSSPSFLGNRMLFDAEYELIGRRQPRKISFKVSDLKKALKNANDDAEIFVGDITPVDEDMLGEPIVSAPRGVWTDGKEVYILGATDWIHTDQIDELTWNRVNTAKKAESFEGERWEHQPFFQRIMCVKPHESIRVVAKGVNEKDGKLIESLHNAKTFKAEAESFEASTNPCQDCGSPSVVSQAKPHPLPYLYFCENCFISRNPFMKGHLAESFAATGVCNCGSSCNCDCGCAESGVCNCGPSCPCNCGCGIGAESFGATVYRGKPMGELGYVERAMATKRMIESADIEQSILQLEAAIRMGLISEEAIMNQLRDKFGSE